MLKNSAVDDCKVSLLVPLYKTPKFFVERIINNALNTDYQRFANFNTQGFQILGGITYKFDF